MIKGSKFRGISYKVGFGYFADKQWNKALREFLTLPLVEDDAQVCEMIATCYHGLGDTAKEKEYLTHAIAAYEKEENQEKADKLKLKRDK
jgi:lipopolysaccharide biosynthesis regulator YciM